MDIVNASEGERLLLLGNEAIVRGAIEAGVAVAATYPGTPSSEIGNTFHRIAKSIGIYFEFSANEKVAVEVAAAAAASGLRALTFMKHVGLNVAADAFLTLAYVGVRGGLVLVSADDPSCHSSQNEQDNRYYSVLANVPMLEPSSPQEAKDMVVEAYSWSEKLELPVILRTTTRISHMRGVVVAGKKAEVKRYGDFEKDPERFVTVPQNARKRHIALLEKMDLAALEAEKSPLNKVYKARNCEFREVSVSANLNSSLGIITAGASFNYVRDATTKYGIDCDVLKLGVTHPVPENLVSSFVSAKQKIVVVEELEPYLEKEVYYICKKYGHDVEILGKISKNFPRRFEYDNDIVSLALLKIMGKDEQWAGHGAISTRQKPPLRPPVLCPGCPHRAMYYAVKKALRGKDTIYATDIGCYTLGIQPPLRTADFLLCMGSSVGSACGFSKATKQTVVAFIGDSTFFHAGIHGLINAAYNKHKFVYVILDNRTTAMTGHQPHPGVGITGMNETTVALKPEDVAKACGATYVKVVNPNNINTAVEAVREAVTQQGVAVIVARAPCALLEVRKKRKSGTLTSYKVNQDKCQKCHLCITQFACPAFYQENNGTVKINHVLCTGCGVCVQVCPYGAIEEEKQ